MSSETVTRKMPKGVTPLRIAITSIVLLFVTIAYGLLISGQIRAEEVISESMSPTVKVGDRLLITQLDPEAEVQRGDIVMVESPTGDTLPLLKRVVGLPGDDVWWVQEEVFVNKRPTLDDLRKRGIPHARIVNKYTLQEDEYFILGDNRENSFDSLYFGPVSRDMIVGEAFYRYAPLSRAGFIDGAEESGEGP